jgi:GT2 family glycosyltransferase
LNPKTSIIIPNWNGFPYLKDCIGSLLSQNFNDDFEILIVDNASTDGSVDWLLLFHQDIVLIKNQENMGFANACNQGAKAAKSDNIIFLNTDMKVAPDFLEKILSAKSENKNAASIAASIMDWDGKKIQFSGGIINFYGHAFQKEANIDEIANNSLKSRELLFSCGGASLYDKKIFLDMGGFDEDYFAYFEDVDLGLRLNLMGHKIIFCPEAITYHIGEASSKSLPKKQKLMLYERNAIYTIIKNYSDNSLAKILPATLLLSFARLSSAITSDNTESIQISDHGIAIINAIQSLIDNIEKIITKRKIIQKRRKLGDDKIFEKFGCFLKTNFFEPRYYNNLLALSCNFEVDKLFTSVPSGETLPIILKEFSSMLDISVKKSIELENQVFVKDFYLKQFEVKDKYISDQEYIINETREFLKEKDRQINKLIEDISYKEELIKSKDKLISTLNAFLESQEKEKREFEKRQLDILKNLRSKLL